MESKKKKEHSIDQGILATFWDLAENEEQKRVDAIQTLVNALSLKQRAVSSLHVLLGIYRNPLVFGIAECFILVLRRCQNIGIQLMTIY